MFSDDVDLRRYAASCGSSSSPLARPSLNSFCASPSDRASFGSFAPPKRRRTSTKMISSSGGPRFMAARVPANRSLLQPRPPEQALVGDESVAALAHSYHPKYRTSRRFGGRIPSSPREQHSHDRLPWLPLLTHLAQERRGRGRHRGSSQSHAMLVHQIRTRRILPCVSCSR